MSKQERTELGYQILDASEGSVFINVDNDDGLAVLLKDVEAAVASKE